MNIKRMLEGLSFLVAAAFLFSITGCGSNLDSDGFTSGAQTVEDKLRAREYIGAAACGSCHEENHQGWLATAHNKIITGNLSEENFTNDSNGSGLSDFFDGPGLNLADEDAFSQYGVNAPKLGKDETGPYMVIGDKQYYITHILGGFGNQWRQLYLTQIGLSHYVLPVQYNAVTKKYVPYTSHDEENSQEEEEDEQEQGWYDADNMPRDIAFSQSFERLCAGCHVTGLELAVSDEDEWFMEFTDLSVSCEACHGPGREHQLLQEAQAYKGDDSPLTDPHILNPATMIFKGTFLDDDELLDNDLTGDGEVDEIDNLIVRNMICYACHSRGQGKFTDSAGNATAYPSRAGSYGKALLYIPSLDWTDYFAVSIAAENYWSDPEGRIIASKGNHQQQQDFSIGVHAPDSEKENVGNCFICHDMHSADKKHMVASTINGIKVEDDDNNTLCLACHAGKGDFEDLLLDQITITSPSIVGPKVISHMGRVAMTGTEVIYDPGGSGQGQCTGCHMPKTAQSALRNEHGIGDISSHTFRIIWPSKNEMDADPDDEENTDLTNLPNSCNGCHQAGDDNDGTKQMLAWAKSGHGDENSEAWAREDWEGDDKFLECQVCHTATGAKNFMSAAATLNDGDSANDVEYDPVNNEFNFPSVDNQVLYCYGCHSDESGKLNDPGPIVADALYTYPDAGGSNACLVCHTGLKRGDSIKNSQDDFSDKEFVHAHYQTAGGQVFKAMGYEFDELDYANPPSYAHDQIGMGTDERLAEWEADNGVNGPCIGCHLSTPEPNSHLFLFLSKDEDDVITATVCAKCHSDDEKKTLSSLQEEKDGMAGLLEVLQETLTSKGFIFAPNWPYFFNSVDNSFDNRIANWGDENNGKNNMGAAFNCILLLEEPGAYAHNSIYAKRLAFDSVDWLDNEVMDGAIDLSEYPEAAEYLQNDGDAANDNSVARP